MATQSPPVVDIKSPRFVENSSEVRSSVERADVPVVASAPCPQPLFGDNITRKLPISDRTQLRFITPSPNALEVSRIESGILGQHSRILNGELSQHIYPVVQAVLNSIVDAAGISGVGPKLFIHDEWNINNACAGYNTIHINTRVLLDCSSIAELACMLAHEMGHLLAGHYQERLNVNLYDRYRPWSLESKKRWSYSLGKVGEHMFDTEVENLDTPAKAFYVSCRLEEYEADYIGSILMAKAGFDPRAAFTIFHNKLQPENKSKVPALSKHPSHEKRSLLLESKLPEAMAFYEASESRESSAREALTARFDLLVLELKKPLVVQYLRRVERSPV